MVAAEAAAAGVLPVSADHSGMREVSRALAEALPAPHRDLLAFPLGDDAVPAIAERLNGWLALDEPERERFGKRAVGARRRAVELGAGRSRRARGLGRPAGRADARVPSWLIAAGAANRMPALDDSRDLCPAHRRRARPHGRDLGRDGQHQLERGRGLDRGRRHRPPAQRDDRAVVVRLLDRARDARLQHLALPRQARRRVRRRADPRQHPARDRLDADPDRDRALRRRPTAG